MDFIDEKLLHYSEAHTTEENQILKELNRETQAHVLNPRPKCLHTVVSLLRYYKGYKKIK